MLEGCALDSLEIKDCIQCVCSQMVLKSSVQKDKFWEFKGAKKVATVILNHLLYYWSTGTKIYKRKDCSS